MRMIWDFITSNEGIFTGFVLITPIIIAKIVDAIKFWLYENGFIEKY